MIMMTERSLAGRTHQRLAHGTAVEASRAVEPMLLRLPMSRFVTASARADPGGVHSGLADLERAAVRVAPRRPAGLSGRRCQCCARGIQATGPSCRPLSGNGPLLSPKGAHRPLSATQHRRYSHAEQGSQCTPSPTIDYSRMPRKHIIVCDVNTHNFGSPPRKGVSQELFYKRLRPPVVSKEVIC